MSTVAPEGRGAQAAPTPPVRHGTGRLTINGTPYRLSKSPTACAAWHLKRLAEPREGQISCALAHHAVVRCLCTDSITNSAVCTYLLALRAVGLVARRATPGAVHAARHLEGGAS
jgi:hypothetical protein